MQFIYIGFWDSLVNKLLNAILKPIVTFLGSLLSKVFSWLFNTVLTPILKSVAVPIFEILLDLLKTVLSGILYSIMAELLKLVDYMEKAFRIIIGLDNVEVKLAGSTVWARAFGAFNGTSSGGYTSMPITEAFFSFDAINKAYWMLNFIGLTLALLFATIAVARSSFDLDFEGRRPVSRVLSSLFRSVVNLFTVQLVLMFIVKLASAILAGIDLAMTATKGGAATSLGRMVFAMASLDACKIADYNVSKSQMVGVTDEIRRGYYYSKCPDGQNFKIYDFTNVSDVELNFDLAKMDFLIGYVLAIFLLIIMGACLIVFVQRLMDMLVLYLASPFFVAMIPLDDGERFGKWRELFIGKCFSGFGMVVAMQLYVMLCPAIMDSTLRMSKNSVEFDYLCRMLFLVGGAWAILKSGNMITGLLSESAGSAEAQTASVAAGVGFGLAKMAGKVGLEAGWSGLKAATGLLKPGDASNKGSFGDEDSSGSGGSENKFDGGGSSYSRSGGEIPGIAGYSAFAGNSGISSGSGMSSTSGVSGTSGTAGTSRVSGTSGVSGRSGMPADLGMSGGLGGSNKLELAGGQQPGAFDGSRQLGSVAAANIPKTQKSSLMSSLFGSKKSKAEAEDSDMGIEMTDLSGKMDEDKENSQHFEESDHFGENEMTSINDYEMDDEEEESSGKSEGEPNESDQSFEENNHFGENELTSINDYEMDDEEESSGKSESESNGGDQHFEESDHFGENELTSINDYEMDDEEEESSGMSESESNEGDQSFDQSDQSERFSEPENISEPEDFRGPENAEPIEELDESGSREPENFKKTQNVNESESLEEAENSEKPASGGEQKPFFEPSIKQKKKLSSSVLGGLIQTYTYRDSKNNITGTSRKFNIGRMFSFETGPKGKEIKLFGMGMRFSGGKINKVDFGIGSISRMRGTDGKMHTSRVKVLGCKVHADMKTGEKKLTDVGAIGLHMKVGKDGHRKLTDLGMIGLHMDMGKDGHRQLKDLSALGIHRKKGEDGKYHTKTALGGMYKNYDTFENEEKKDEEKK
ncbi:Mbov_0396 family ICE element transmembrane protein [Brotaphodocola sp.]|uniref:Mbov_0396 family ICE element transmembrane protein n=1 Tax=Brotaphodocola sp. TaxID=3073577 RepID=UPI003D7EAB83